MGAGPPIRQVPSFNLPTGVVRWGILGAGKISNDFCIGLLNNKSKIAAVGARDLERAQALAKKVGAERAHGSYEALVSDPEVDVIYIGTVNTGHLEHARLALQAGKHVLCEKPMCIDEKGVTELKDLAQSKNLFLMEAMWTRFFPAFRKVRDIIQDKQLGVPQYVQGNLGFVAPFDTQHRLWNPALGGGATLDMGCFLVQYATMLFGSVVPDQLRCTGTRTEAGVEKDCVMSMQWNGKGSASFITSLTSNLEEHVLITCTQGFLKICGPAHCPSKIVVARSFGRGQYTEKELTFDLPKCPAFMTANYPNSEGFLYQAQATETCLLKGQLECPEFTLEESLTVARIIDACRKQLGTP